MIDFRIVKEKVATWHIAENGNQTFKFDKERFVLKNDNDEVISHQYYCMFQLDNDHFAVCDLISEATFWSNYNEYDIIKGEYETTTPKMKWGVIRINRDASGAIIPGAETMVVPYLYDRISSNNMRTATVESNGKFSYLDLDVSRSSYGRQLVPCILEHAVPFCVDIEGFAECSIGNTVGYLPRECKPCDELESFELLTKKQAECIASILNNVENVSVILGAITSYFALTGIQIEQGKKLVLEKSTNAQS